MNNFLQVNVLTSFACKERIFNIKKTWGQHLSNIIYYADFNEETDIVKCTEIPSAVGNEQKILNRLIEVKKNNNHDWYFFVDDDTFINSKNLLTFINNADKNKTYGRLVGGWGISYFQGGAGVLISNLLIDKIDIKTLYLRGSTFSDVLFGQVMRDNNLELINVETFYDRSPSSYQLNTAEIQQAITFHQVANSMLELYKKVYE